MIEFPTLIEYIEECTLTELHKMHEDAKVYEDNEQSFSDYVEEQYSIAQEMWQDAINEARPIKIEMVDDGEVQKESAKLVLKQIIVNGLKNRDIPEIILKDDMAPDYRSAVSIVESFWDDVMPAVEKALEEI